MKKPAAVLFDCDGVVVDSEHLTNEVLRDDLAERGLDLPLPEIMARFVGGTMKGVGEKAAAAGANIPVDWLDQVYPKIYAALADHVEAIPGISEVLDSLDRNDVPYAIGSNGEVRKMETTLGRTGLTNRFLGRMFSAQEMDAPKPAPDVYLHAARALRVAPNRCIVVEDSASGAQAGQAAGMRVFGFIRDTDPTFLEPHCDLLFSDMAKLPDLIGVK